MNVLGTKIKQLRKENNLNQSEFAEALNRQFNLNIDRVMVSKWETGFQTPIMSTVVSIAKFFNVSIDYLNGNENYAKNFKYPAPEITEDYTTFPVIGEIAAGYDNPAYEDYDGEVVEIPNSYLKGRQRDEFFVLRVKGDSMYPMYQDGDRVLILKQSTLNNSGDIGAVLYDDEYGTLKKVEYVYGEDWMRLVPINPTYKPELIEGERLEHCRVMGIPKLLIRDI